MTLKRQIIYGGLWGDEVLGVEAPKRETMLMASDFQSCKPIIIKNHYLHSTPGIRPKINLLIYYQGVRHGALMLGYGQSYKITEEENIIAFDRMWLSDVMPKFSETCVLGLLHTYLRAAHPEITHIVTHADTGVGNSGTIYRAANYEYKGDHPSPYWFLPDGRKIHNRTLYGWHGRPGNNQKWLESRYPGIKRQRTPMRKYIYELGRRKKSLID